ncbi:MAG: DUF1553 domain-containing protein [Acidobacteriia bacterium]|nr:DUF1553 domain-containing protein [Terriglobia bacterium]MYC67334.1 DUF1553 domain-containing protein [Terriglobia bacterium]
MAHRISSPLFVIAAAIALALPGHAKVDYQSDVRPLLSDKCFQCHGPDAATRTVDLRLDRREGLFGHRPNGTPVVPGDPDSSLVFQRITHTDAALRMPPEYSHKSLESADIDTIRTWIEEGAEWTGHWAFEIPKRPELPAVRDADWARNPIDRFVLARLEEEGLAPAPEADRRSLARRAALDVTGLPPSPEIVDAFVDDDQPGAFQRYLDVLFAAESYGEHRARYWLDAARYADTHGIHIDNYREMWPYRDWVINAFNRNLPFDQFTLEQVAGDLLPSPTMDQLIASGFHRCNATTNEGGVIPEEYEVIYAKDRADTTGTVFLGLTVGCATCHDHKFDPITQRDFYAMTAFFRNTTQYVMDGNISDTPPFIIVPTAEDRAHYDELRETLRTARSESLAASENPGEAFEEWLAQGGYGGLQNPLATAKVPLHVSHDRIVHEGTNGPLALPDGVSAAEGPTGNLQALEFEGDGFLEVPNSGIDTDTPFSLAFWVRHPEDAGSYIVLSQTDPDNKMRGWQVTLGGREIIFRMIAANEDEASGEDKASDEDEASGEDEELDEDTSSNIEIRPNNQYQLEPGSWRHVTVTYDGSGERAGLNIYYNGERMPFQGSEYFAKLDGMVASDQPVLLGGGFYKDDGEVKPRGMPGGAIADVRLYDRELSLEEANVVANWPSLESARSKPPAELSDLETHVLGLHYLNVHDERYRERFQAAKRAERGIREVRRRGAVTHVMQEREDREAAAHILFRGMYDQRRDKVPAATPGFLPSLEDSGPVNRLHLARWLIANENPLTSRVAVNRFWQQVFGEGLVRTSDDFGAQGESPSHPALLDWLSVEFRENGWDVKQLLRTMLSSAAYRQSAEADQAKVGKDPQNRLLSRGPRFRMDAEMLRDFGLAATGILVEKIGGPSVKPYQPDGVWESVAMLGSNTRHYKRDDGDKLYRRSLYTFWKRAAPPASMQIFNAPTREHATVRRERTNTPLQALVTMNDPQFVEAARFLAQTALKQAQPDFASRLDFLTKRLLSREFSTHERTVAEQSLADFLRHYEEDSEDASKLLATGEATVDEDLPAPELAAWTMMANQLMNLDEALNK